MKIEIYDPPMCCPSGLCGPAVDPALMKINDAILTLKKQGVTVERFNIKTDYMSLTNNKLIMDLLKQNGAKILPITVIENSIFKTGKYPTYGEICKKLNIEPLKANKPISLRIG